MLSDFSITTLAGGFQLTKILKGHLYGCCRLMNSEKKFQRPLVKAEHIAYDDYFSRNTF